MTPAGEGGTPAARGSRAGRITRALTLGYTYQAVVAVTGLVLTPFLLRELGVTDYGRWLVVGQVLGLLGLLDLGVTGVLPREVARASGTAGTEPVGEVVRRAWWLVWLQTPVVGLIAAGVWYGVSEARPELSGPLALILGVFVVQFPLRVPAAVLNGLQDLTFAAAVQAIGWLVTTVVSVTLVFADWGLYALAVGWSAGQLLSCVMCWLRLRRNFPLARAATGWPGGTNLRGHLGPSLWVSLSQVAQLLVFGTELLVIGWVLGPGAVVVYACSTKLIALFRGQPYAIAATSIPALSEMRRRAGTEDLVRAAKAVGLLMVFACGGFAILIAAVTPAFVSLWVGREQYSGALLTVLALSGMVARQIVFTWSNMAFVFGYERRLAGVAVADGILTVTGTVLYATLLGVDGVPLGGLTALVLVTAPSSILAVSTELGISVGTVCGWYRPWISRFGFPFAVVACFSFRPEIEAPFVAAAVASVGLATYSALLYPLLRREPLRSYWDRMVGTVKRIFGRTASSQTTTPDSAGGV